jgi:predicted enzyme related to lactoylglutathione lyase
MIKHVAFFVYPVSDIAKARQFYERTLGLKLVNNAEDHWLEYDIQGVTFAITDWLEGATPGSRGAMAALEVADVQHTLEFFKSQGVQVLKELFDTPACRICVIADPDGNGILIHQALVPH